MKHVKFLIVRVLYLLTLALYAQERPNIIFILTDDQSYGMMGYDGNPIVKTPNLDKLGYDGTFFTNAHITSGICTPSRVSILLGQYERMHGVNFNSGTSVSEEAWAKSYPVLMRNAGYYTGWVGKNHAPVGNGGYGSGLMEKSFDYWYAGHGHLSFYPKKVHAIFNDAIAHTQPEIINEGVNDFIDNNERRLEGAIRFFEQRPEDKPFLLSINFNLPHGNGTKSMKQLPEDNEIYKSLYRDLEIPMPQHYIAKADIKTPKLPEDLLRAEDRQEGYNYVDKPATTKERYIRQLQAMTGIDCLVGNLRNKLKALKLDKNTVIIFASDHGLFMGEQGLGGKAFCYEKITHIPLIIMDPRVKRKQKGVKADALVQSLDIASTILALGGVESPNSFQGKNILPLVYGENEKIRDYVFTENLWSTQFGNPRCEAVQNKTWKYIRYYKNNNLSATQKINTAKQLKIPVNTMLYTVHDPDIALYRSFVEGPLNGEQPVYEELYHLTTDPHELHNVIEDEDNKTVLETLRAEWQRQIAQARGTDKPKVLRYTTDSHVCGGD